MEKEENRRPQHFLFSFEMKGESERQRETKKEPYLDTLDALILCDLLQLKKGAFMDEMPQLNRIALQQSEAFTCELSQEIHNTTVQILFAIYLYQYVCFQNRDKGEINWRRKCCTIQFNHCYCLMFFELPYTLYYYKNCVAMYLRLYFQ